jgi:hypothetical protein
VEAHGFNVDSFEFLQDLDLAVPIVQVVVVGAVPDDQTVPALGIDIDVADGRTLLLGGEQPQKILLACLGQLVSAKLGINLSAPSVQFVALRYQNLGLLRHDQFADPFCFWQARKFCVFEDKNILLELESGLETSLLNVVVVVGCVQPSVTIAVAVLLIGIVGAIDAGFDRHQFL